MGYSMTCVDGRPVKVKSIFLFLFGVLFVSWAQAQDREAQARKIEALLVAPCCWSSPVSQHGSEAAAAIKSEIRQMLAAGKTEDEILAAFEKKYGERIMARPKASGFNLLVWLLPGVFLLAGAFAAIFVLRRWKPAQNVDAHPETPPSVDPEYVRRIDKELYDS
jgi:cytochrome c-type biogenesis protein CcmH